VRIRAYGRDSDRRSLKTDILICATRRLSSMAGHAEQNETTARTSRHQRMGRPLRGTAAVEAAYGRDEDRIRLGSQLSSS